MFKLYFVFKLCGTINLQKQDLKDTGDQLKFVFIVCTPWQLVQFLNTRSCFRYDPDLYIFVFIIHNVFYLRILAIWFSVTSVLKYKNWLFNLFSYQL